MICLLKLSRVGDQRFVRTADWAVNIGSYKVRFKFALLDRICLKCALAPSISLPPSAAADRRVSVAMFNQRLITSSAPGPDGNARASARFLPQDETRHGEARRKLATQDAQRRFAKNRARLYPVRQVPRLDPRQIRPLSPKTPASQRDQINSLRAALVRSRGRLSPEQDGRRDRNHRIKFGYSDPQIPIVNSRDAARRANPRAKDTIAERPQCRTDKVVDSRMPSENIALGTIFRKGEAPSSSFPLRQESPVHKSARPTDRDRGFLLAWRQSSADAHRRHQEKADVALRGWQPSQCCARRATP